ncbi:MAG: mercury methylation corrinoid protein HgcA, partial [Anaerolineae bacterium]
GPVRAADLPEYLKNHQATEEMRRVRFTLLDRLVLIPVELVHLFVPMVLVAILLYALSGWLAAASAVAAVLAGVVLFPILLPWLPTRDFSSKGFILGGLVALPFALEAFSSATTAPLWLRLSIALAYLFALPPVTAFLALNFTGSTPITSRSGVKREIFTYIPMMAWMFGIGIVLAVGVRLFQQLGGA